MPVGRPPSHQGVPLNIKFSEVASSVGKKFKNGPNPNSRPLSKSASTPGGGRSAHGLDTAKEPAAPVGFSSTVDTSGSADFTQPASAASTGSLPPLRGGPRVERLVSQLEWLQAEQDAQTDQHKAIEQTQSRALELEKMAGDRAHEFRGQLALEERRAFAIERQIESLRAELGPRESRNGPPGQSRGSPGQSREGQSRRPNSRAQSATAYELKSVDGIQGTRSPMKHCPQPLMGRMHEQDPMRKPNDSAQEQQREQLHPQSKASPTSKAPFDDVSGMSLAEYVDRDMAFGGTLKDDGRPPRLNASQSDSNLGRIKASPLEDFRLLEDSGPSSSSKADILEHQRDLIRREMIASAGSAKAALRCLDLNGSGNVSLGEFADGLTRLGVPWQEITGKKWPADVFRLMDQNKDGHLDFKELFPAEASRLDKPDRPSTPEFWKLWLRKNSAEDFEGRSPNWAPNDAAMELQVLLGQQEQLKQAQDRRKWIQDSFRRLKNKGKSDAKARECVCDHLPKGTGPRDRDGCHTFSESEGMVCKKQYTDAVQEHVKNIQKVVYDFREQRRILNHSRLQLVSVTGKLEEDRKQPAFAGLLQNPPPAPAPEPPDDQEIKAGRQEKRRTMAAELLTDGAPMKLFGR